MHMCFDLFVEESEVNDLKHQVEATGLHVFHDFWIENFSFRETRSKWMLLQSNLLVIPLHPRPILIYCKILLMNDNLNVQMIEFVLFSLHERQSKMFLASNLEYCIIFCFFNSDTFAVWIWGRFRRWLESLWGFHVSLETWCLGCILCFRLRIWFDCFSGASGTAPCKGWGDCWSQAESFLEKIVQMSVVFNASKLILSYAFASSIPLQVRRLEKSETCLHGFWFMHDFVFVLKVSFMKKYWFSCFLFLRMPIKSSEGSDGALLRCKKASWGQRSWVIAAARSDGLRYEGWKKLDAAMFWLCISDGCMSWCIGSCSLHVLCL